MNKIFPFLNWLPMVNADTMKADLMAGLTGAIIVLPQGVAFAMIAGMPPIYGLYTAMITPIIAALFGSSFHLISGPTTAISIVVFSAVTGLGFAESTPEFVAMALTLTFLAGVIQFLFGLIRLGALVNFVSHTVVIGFTAGAGILIAGKQLKHVFGIKIASGTPFYDILYQIATRIGETNWYAFAVAMSTLAIALLVRKFARKLPYMLIAMVGGSVVALLIGGEEVGIKFVEEMPSQLPPFKVPQLWFGDTAGTIEMMEKLIPKAFAIAMLGLIEAVAIARAIALSSRQRIDGNQEFIGQGLSNLIASFFSSYAGSGSFTRSGVNYQAGAKTPIAAIVAAVILMIVVVFVAPLASYLPIPAMGGIILLVGYNLVDIPHIKEIIKASPLETTVLAVTFFSTLLLHLDYAIYVGVLFSLIFYLKKTSNPNIAVLVPNPADDRKLTNIARDESLKVCPQMKMVRIDDALYYGSIESITDFMEDLRAGDDKHVIIMAQGISYIDLAGSEWLVQEARRWEERGGSFSICGLKRVAQDVLIKGGFKEKLGEENFYEKKQDAINAIYQKLDKDICANCSAKIFSECLEETFAELDKK